MIPISYTVRLMFSNVPTTVPDLDKYFGSLKEAIVAVLRISSEWNIDIAVEGDLPKGRRSSLTSNIAVGIVFTSISAGPGDLSTLQGKLDSPAFLEGLNAMGFKASLLELIITKSSMSSTSGECCMYPIHEFFRFLLHEITLHQAVYRLCTEDFLFHLQLQFRQGQTILP
jgi:hypothetical protein